MHIVKTTDTTHIIKLIPRYYDYGTVVLTLVNEENKEVLVPEITLSTANGFVFVGFDYSFTLNSRFSILLKDKNEVVYRGKLICLDENTQDYKQSKEYYVYEY